MPMTQETWLSAHPYLRPVAELHARVNAAADEIRVPVMPVPDFEPYRDDFCGGVPLLKSANTGIDLAEAERAVDALVTQLDPEDQEASSGNRGLRRYLRWTVLGRSLRPVIRAFGDWRDDERWLRNYCPTCGELPAMAQLIGGDPGRLRFLSCGCCRTRWRYRRTACPFCDSQGDHRLLVLDVDGERGLRIDYCDTCRGYLKTYNGAGSESVLLADWTSLHLDFIARARGLKRSAASLYELEPTQ